MKANLEKKNSHSSPCKIIPTIIKFSDVLWNFKRQKDENFSRPESYSVWWAKYDRSIFKASNKIFTFFMLFRSSFCCKGQKTLYGEILWKKTRQNWITKGINRLRSYCSELRKIITFKITQVNRYLTPLILKRKNWSCGTRNAR